MGSIVVAGKQFNCVLTEGGNAFIELIRQLNPEAMRLNPELSFFSPRKDSNEFYGSLRFSYITPTTKLSDQEAALFQRYYSAV